MANIGKIAAIVSATDASFSATMKRVANATEQTYSKVNSIASRMGGSISGMLSGIAAGGAAYTVVERLGAALNRLDDAGDAADAVGLRPEFLMGIEYHAKFAGVEVETLRGAIVKMQRTIAEAAGGSKSDQDILAGLGLDPKKLAAMDTERQLLSISNALKEVRNQGELLRATGGIFGGKGMAVGALAQYLRGGSGKILGGVAEAQQLGVAKTSAQIAGASTASDAIDKARLAIEGAQNTIAEDAAPAVTALAKAVQESVTAQTRLGTAGETLTQGLLKFAVPILNSIDKLAGYGKLINAFNLRGFMGRLVEAEKSTRNADGSTNYQRYWAKAIDGQFAAMGAFDDPEQFGDKVMRLYEEERKKIAEATAAAAQKVTQQTQATEQPNRHMRMMLQLREIEEERAAKVMARVAAEKKAAEALADQLRIQDEIARIQEEDLAQRIAEQVFNEQRDAAKTAADQAKRLAELENAAPGGTAAVLAGSNDARILQFNAQFGRNLSVQEKQLTTQERIKTAIEQNANDIKEIRRLFDQVMGELRGAAL